MNDSTNAITLIGAQLAEFDAVEAGLSELEQKFGGVAFPVATTNGMSEAIAARAACRAPRIKVEKVRKDAKAPVLALGRSIDSRAAEITARLVALEDPIDDQIKAEEARKEAARAEKERIERERLAAIAAAEMAERERMAAERRAAEAKLAEERRVAAEALAAERAEANRLAQIERDKLAAERAEFERQHAADQAAAKAERLRREAEARHAAEEAARVEHERAAAVRAAEAEAARLAQIEHDRLAAERAAADAAAEKVRAAAPLMLDTLIQWRHAEASCDTQKLQNAKNARDAAIDAALN